MAKGGPQTTYQGNATTKLKKDDGGTPTPIQPKTFTGGFRAHGFSNGFDGYRST